MDRRHRIVLPLAAGLLAAAAGLMPAEAAVRSLPENSTDAVLTSVRLSPDRIALSGLGTARVMVEVGIRSPSLDADTPTNPVLVPISKDGGVVTDPVRSSQTVAVSLVQGTRRDGLWRGWFTFASSAVGTWHVGCALVRYSGPAVMGGCADPGPVTYPALTVVGTHVPVLSARVSPDPIRGGRSVTVSGRLADSVTGAPFVGVQVDVAAEPDGGRPSPARSVRTGKDGRYRVVLDHNRSGEIGVRVPVPGAWTTGSPPVYAAVKRSLHYVMTVSAVPAARRVTLARSVIVTGHVRYRCLSAGVTGTTQPLVQLQRRHQGGWITVADVRVAYGGAFRVTSSATARGGSRGVHDYRVVLPAQERYLRAVSPVVRVTIT